MLALVSILIVLYFVVVAIRYTNLRRQQLDEALSQRGWYLEERTMVWLNRWYPAAVILPQELREWMRLGLDLPTLLEQRVEPYRPATQLRREEQAARRPPSPDSLVGALQGTVHKSSGRVLATKSVKVQDE